LKLGLIPFGSVGSLRIEEEGHSKELLDQYDLFAKDGGLGLHEFDKDCGKAVK
jgi:hypothetical protein